MVNHKGTYEKYIKRVLDIGMSSIALVVLSPIIGISAVLVKFKLGSPVLFKQPRPGKKEKIFYLYKFRSMTNSTDADGKLLPDSERLTKFGKFLRKSSIDELPELFNILKGDMSIVGPRPLSIYYLPHYTGDSKKRHTVRPGLTGLAQVNGRNSLPWDDRFALDAQYTENITFINDLKIILKTVLKVLKASDIAVRGTTKVYDYGTYKTIQDEGNIPVLGSKMTYSEIGSYFWLKDDAVMNRKQVMFLPKVADSEFTFSGRTAIEIALRNICKIKKVKTLYAPSYCCVSMLQSFVDRGIKIEFYDVSMKNGAFNYAIDADKNCDIILFMGYFGFEISKEIICKIKKLQMKGAIVIEDITHSMFNEETLHEFSDYYVASLRKWFAIPTGGWIGKQNGKLMVKPDIDSNNTVTNKIDGMKKKYEYISKRLSDTQKKEEFLQIQSKFDNDLIHVDRMLKIDDTSLRIMANCDTDDVKKKRKNNAKWLKENLADLDGKVLDLPQIDLNAITPLFYPIFMKTEDRDELRKYMIRKGIYSPIHWPEVMGTTVGIRANELSLICDQRYSETDMKAICDCIHEWYGGKQK